MKKEKKPEYISYSTMWNITPKNKENWLPEFKDLTAEDAIIAAVDWSNMKLPRIQKLINHTSKRFLFMKTKKTIVQKHFHDSPVTYISLDFQLHERAKKLIEEDNLINQ